MNSAWFITWRCDHRFGFSFAKDLVELRAAKIASCRSDYVRAGLLRLKCSLIGLTIVTKRALPIRAKSGFYLTNQEQKILQSIFLLRAFSRAWSGCKPPVFGPGYMFCRTWRLVTWLPLLCLFFAALGTGCNRCLILHRFLIGVFLYQICICCQPRYQSFFLLLNLRQGKALGTRLVCCNLNVMW